MTTAAMGFRPASLRTKKEFCGYCNEPLPAKRRRSREYCSKSCCNRASEERGKVNGRTRPDGLPPFWPLGLEKDFALLGAVRGSVRTVCDELWSLLRRVDAEELEFRRSVEILRGRLISQLDPHDLLVSVERLLAEVNKEHAQELSQLQNEKDSAERISEVNSERSRRLKGELAQVRAESTRREESCRKKEEELRSKEEQLRSREEQLRGKEEQLRSKEEQLRGREEEGRRTEDDFRKREDDYRKKEEDFRKKEEKLKQRLDEVSAERDAATKKCELLQVEHEHLKSTHHKLAESIATLQRKKPEKDEVIDVTEQLSVVGKRVKSIHDWVESRSSQPDPQTQFQQTRLEQFAEVVAQKLSKQLVIRVDTSGQTAQLQRLQQGVVTLTQQMDWLINQRPEEPQQPAKPSDKFSEKAALKALFEYLKLLRRELSLDPVKAGLEQLAGRIAEMRGDWSTIVHQLQSIDYRIAHLPSPTPVAMPSRRNSDESVTKLKREKAALKRRLDKLEPLAQENEELQEQLGEAAQVIRFLKARQPVPGIELDDVGALMLDIVDLKNEIAEYQQALGIPVTERPLADKSPMGRRTAVAELLRAARWHLVRSPAPMFGEAARWDSDGTTLNRAGEDRLEEVLEKAVKRLRKLYGQLYREYHED